MKAGPVTVKLSAKGEEFADGSAIEVGGANYHFRFEPGKSLEVTRVLDWERVLSKERVAGEPMFELVTEAAPEQAESAGEEARPKRR